MLFLFTVSVTLKLFMVSYFDTNCLNVFCNVKFSNYNNFNAYFSTKKKTTFD